MPTSDRTHAESLAVSAAEVIAKDPELQNEMRALVRQIMGHCKRTMRLGSVAQKDALMKSLMPAMLRSMSTVESEQREREERAAYDRLIERLGGEA